MITSTGMDWLKSQYSGSYNDQKETARIDIDAVVLAFDNFSCCEANKKIGAGKSTKVSIVVISETIGNLQLFKY